MRRAILLERVRTAEHRVLAGQAHEAEAMRQKMEQLSQRTISLAEVYARHGNVATAAELVTARIIGSHVRELSAAAAQHAGVARREADAKIVDLAVSDRRRQIAEDRRRDLARSLADQAFRAESPPLQRVGTHLE